MKPVSIRFGFATNSSSYHSLVQGTPSWSNLSKQEIIERFLKNKTKSSFRPSYGEYIDEISEMDDIVTYGLYSIILEDLDTYSYYGNHNMSEYEFELLTKGFSSDIIELTRKLEPYFNDLYVSDDTSSAYNFAAKFKNKEEAFWNFVYGVSSITES